MAGLSERRKHRAHPPLFRRILTVNALRLVSFVVLFWGEHVVFWSASCQWPDDPLRLTEEVDRTHVLLVADPQVKEPLSFWDTWSIIERLKLLIFSSNIRKSWNVARKTKPDLIIFMGDMLASGKYAETREDFSRYWTEFQRIFPLSSKNNVYYIPGNNDVGMGTGQQASKSVRQFYKRRFGRFNQAIEVQNHTFVLLDAPGLVDEDYQRSAHGARYDNWTPLRAGPVEFVQSVAPSDKVVLFTHVPLYRPDRSSCGPLREKGTLRKGVGHGYQNTLGKQTTQFLLDTLHPTYIFSGDNRDYCDYTHSWMTDSTDPVSRAREVSVKSFSMARNIRKPGFHLLTLISPPPKPAPPRATLADRPCFLPDQYSVYTSIYYPWAILSLLALFIINFMRTRHLRTAPGIAPIATSRSSGDLSSLHSPSGTPLLRPSNSDNVWSPYNTPVPQSPRGALPPKLRTPNTASIGPSLRAASRPSTPQQSPLLPPVTYMADDEDDDHLYSSQYAIHRNPHLHDDDWTPGHEPNMMHFPHNQRETTVMSPSPYFLPAPGGKAATKPRWSWSWTFVFRGRRRRMTIRFPRLSWAMLKEASVLFYLRDTDAEFLRRGVWKSTLLDWVAIFFPFFLTWVFLLWLSS